MVLPKIRNLLLCALIFVVITGAASAACTKFPDGLGGYRVTCSDGNNYSVQRNELLGSTTMRGNNPYTGSTWSSEYQNNGITSPTMRGTDANGSMYNCTFNTFTNKWQCL